MTAVAWLLSLLARAFGQKMCKTFWSSVSALQHTFCFHILASVKTTNISYLCSCLSEILPTFLVHTERKKIVNLTSVKAKEGLALSLFLLDSPFINPPPHWTELWVQSTLTYDTFPYMRSSRRVNQIWKRLRCVHMQVENWGLFANNLKESAHSLLLGRTFVRSFQIFCRKPAGFG